MDNLDSNRNEKFSDLVKECIDVLDENIRVLNDIEFDLKDESENELTPHMELHDLYDMAEDVTISEKLKRAEFSFSQRQL